MNESESIQNIFNSSLVEDIDDENAWNSIDQLRSLGTREVFDLAIHHTMSTSRIARVRAVDILAQLKNNTHPWKVEAGRYILQMLPTEPDARVLQSCIIGLGYIKHIEAVDKICAFQTHANSEVRRSVAFALASFLDESELATETIMILMKDQHEEVRDWATFGLGTLCERDTPSIRDALSERLTDVNFDAHCEAIAGLGLRKDLRALPWLLKYFDDGWESGWSIEVATGFLELDSEPIDWSTEMFAKALRKKFNF